MNSFHEIGERIGALCLGVNNAQYDMVKSATSAVDVESEDVLVRSASTNFLRSYCHAAAEKELKNKGYTFDVAMLTKLANTEEWIREYQDFAEYYMGKEVDQKDAVESEQYAELRKQANRNLLGMLPSVAGKVGGAAPTAIKALIASGIALGTAGGGLYWGLKRNINEDAESNLDVMQAKIDEYRKINRMLKEDADGSNAPEEAAMEKRIKAF